MFSPLPLCACAERGSASGKATAVERDREKNIGAFKEERTGGNRKIKLKKTITDEVVAERLQAPLLEYYFAVLYEFLLLYASPTFGREDSAISYIYMTATVSQCTG